MEWVGPAGQLFEEAVAFCPGEQAAEQGQVLVDGLRAAFRKWAEILLQQLRQSQGPEPVGQSLWKPCERIPVSASVCLRDSGDWQIAVQLDELLNGTGRLVD